MIVTVATVVVLVVGILSLSLAMYGGYTSISITEGLKGNEEERHQAEQKYYLLGMIGIIVLAARLTVVPIFFWMLQDLVPYCPGAMCASGVVNVATPYSVVAIALKILIPFGYGLWFVLEVANRPQPNQPFIKLLARTFLIGLLPLLVVDSAMDLLTVAVIRPIEVPCCSSVYDVDPPFSPSSILGPEFGIVILVTTIIVTFVLIGIQWSEEHRPRLSALTLVLSATAAVLYLVTLHDTYAPLVLGLSTHHCPYCLFQEFPDTALFSGFFGVGVATAGWRVSLERLWTKQGLQREDIKSLTTALMKVSSVSLLFSMVSMLSHLTLVL